MHALFGLLAVIISRSHQPWIFLSPVSSLNRGDGGFSFGTRSLTDYD